MLQNVMSYKIKDDKFEAGLGFSLLSGLNKLSRNDVVQKLACPQINARLLNFLLRT